MGTIGLGVAAALAWAAPAWAAEIPEREKPPYAAPASDEAHGLEGAEREAALLVLRSHYDAFAEVYGGLSLPGRDRKEPSKRASCRVPFALRPEEFRPGSFVDGLPVRRAQPIVFNSVQRQLVEGQGACEGRVLMTRETWQRMEDAGLEFLLRESGTTYCRADSDCYGAELTVDPCGARRRVRVFGSNTTDAVFFVAFRKFMPMLMANLQQMVNGTIGEAGDAHPDHGIPMTTDACPMKHWEERPLASVCVRRSCRAAP